MLFVSVTLYSLKSEERRGLKELRDGKRSLTSGRRDKAIRRLELDDPAESNIRPDAVPATKIGNVKIAGETSWEAAKWKIWQYLTLTGLVVLLLEWYIYIRRVY